MNILQKQETAREAFLKSKTETHENKIVYALIKEDSNFGKVTDDERIVKIFTECHDYKIYCKYRNGALIL